MAAGTEADGSEPTERVPRRRDRRLPIVAVVTLAEQLGWDDAFGSAVELVREWRWLRTGGARVRNGVGRARAEERRWELEVETIREFGLTLAQETGPLDHSRRDDHLGWRRQALERARRERARAAAEGGTPGAYVRAVVELA